jgi:hypothetical protein
MGVGAYSTVRDTNATIAPGDIRAEEFTQQQIVNSIRQLMADIATWNTAATMNGTFTGTFNGGVSGTFNGTVGATTPNTGAFTTVTASGAITSTGGAISANTTVSAGTSIAATTGLSFGTTLSSSQTVAGQAQVVSLRNISGANNAQIRFSLGNDLDANDFYINLFGSGVVGSPRQVEIKANAGNMVLTVGGLLSAPTVNTNTTATAANVNVDASGNLKKSTSSKRYKKFLKKYTRGLDFIRKMKPVFYRSKSKHDDDKTVYAGLIAEHIHDLGMTEFVTYDAKGRPDGLAYPHMAALFVKCFQEMDDKVRALEAKVKELTSAKR